MFLVHAVWKMQKDAPYSVDIAGVYASHELACAAMDKMQNVFSGNKTMRKHIEQFTYRVSAISVYETADVFYTHSTVKPRLGGV